MLAYDDNYRRRKALGKYGAIYIPADTYNLANAIILYIDLSVFSCICFVMKSADNKIADLSFFLLDAFIIRYNMIGPRTGNVHPLDSQILHKVSFTQYGNFCARCARRRYERVKSTLNNYDNEKTAGH